jgi:hypothetical protein
MVEVFSKIDYDTTEFNDACTSPGGPLHNGFRIISLCVYRSEFIVRYAAVWIKDTGLRWVPFYNKNADGFQKFFNTSTGNGFSLMIVSASGGGVIGENETLKDLFAGVLIKGGSTYAKHAMDGKAFKDECASAKKNNFVLRCATMYAGSPDLIAAIWEKPRRIVEWDYRFFKSYDSPELGVPVTMPGNPSLKLSFVTRSPVGEHLGVYRSDYNLDIIERHEMTLSGYNIEEKKMKKIGYLPWIIQVGADPRFGTDAINMRNVVALFRKDLANW